MPVYCPPKKLREAIIESKQRDELTPEAFGYLWAIANNLSRKLRYKDPMDREDCIMFAMKKVLMYWRGYDPEKSNNAFAYYSQMIKNGLAYGWNKLHPVKTSDRVSLSYENQNLF